MDFRAASWQQVAGGAAAAWLVLAAPAVAEESRLIADEVEGLPPEPVRIAIGPEFVAAGDDSGQPRYAVRSTVAERGVSVVFSSTPPAMAGARDLAGVALPGQWPVSFTRLTSGFGLRMHPIERGQLFHAGIDLAAPAGSPIVATADGTVGSAGWNGGYGLMVAIAHGGGMQTRYAHMSRLAVAPGQAVRQGEVIGYVGSTGRSTGPHLHYEVRVNGVAVNPLR